MATPGSSRPGRLKRTTTWIWASCRRACSTFRSAVAPPGTAEGHRNRTASICHSLRWRRRQRQYRRRVQRRTDPPDAGRQQGGMGCEVLAFRRRLGRLPLLAEQVRPRSQAQCRLQRRAWREQPHLHRVLALLRYHRKVLTTWSVPPGGKANGAALTSAASFPFSPPFAACGPPAQEGRVGGYFFQMPWCSAAASCSSKGPTTSVGRCPVRNTSRQGRSSVGFSGWLPVNSRKPCSLRP
jgi:hypothetical protein